MCRALHNIVHFDIHLIALLHLETDSKRSWETAVLALLFLKKKFPLYVK